MTYEQIQVSGWSAMDAIHATLLAFPIACFSLTVVTDAAYWWTENLLWLHFSEWLLLAGLLIGAIELLVRIIEVPVRKVRPSWLAILGGIVVLLLATVNSFVHTTDGWTAVVPLGLTLSIVTVLFMIVTAWFGRFGVYRV
jgi:uncharacterized membrane protein